MGNDLNLDPEAVGSNGVALAARAARVGSQASLRARALSMDGVAGVATSLCDPRVYDDTDALACCCCLLLRM